MLNVGVVGFGNLGKEVAKQIKKDKDFNLTAIFSRRDIEGCVNYNNILDYTNKIDLLFLCGGSQSDIEKQACFLIKHFNTIDCYDNHNRLKSYISKIDTLAKENNKYALCALGWDPGIFSLMRGMFSALGFYPYTFWGKGVSQGHTQAIKQIKGVKDAVQFTIPDENLKRKIKQGKNISDNCKLHSRKCFVVCDKKDNKRVKHQITNMPDYFKGYKTAVTFTDAKNLNKLKSFLHKGEVVTHKNIMNFSLNIPSNPEFTAKIMISFAKSLIFLNKNDNYGAKTIFDIPFRYIIQQDIFNFL